MKKTYQLIFLMSCLGTIVQAQSAQKDQVEIVVDALTQVMLHPNIATLDRLISEDVSYGHTSGLVQNKKEIIESMTNGPFHFLTIDITLQTIKIIDDVALVRQVLSTDYSNKSEKGKYELGVLLVWHLEVGEWKLLARQTVKI